VHICIISKLKVWECLLKKSMITLFKKNNCGSLGRVGCGGNYPGVMIINVLSCK
jgi:hypothetical protein